MATEPVPLGRLVGAHTDKRDAVHVAIEPVTAPCRLHPGQWVDPRGRPVDDHRLAAGIVDPFLTRPVEAGERFFLCLRPNTVTGMTHHWQHPLFPV